MTNNLEISPISADIRIGNLTLGSLAAQQSARLPASVWCLSISQITGLQCRTLYSMIFCALPLEKNLSAKKRTPSAVTQAYV